MKIETQEMIATVIKEFDHLKLIWIRDKGYIIFNSINEDITLVRFGEDKDQALKNFDLMVFNYLKETYKIVI
ncbi:hypothetical protein [Metabacillus sediminilitoris]|uniref:Uncharacterized protein n=1 Tax=Metabacillus sediminilitoris TaxID=2567941 RepID=A0A4S4BKW5_9BACI|nr:hypothetical protein [Metabacillus sediminilitoris]QGQ44839.1 hypothetical protein GMB29_05905 [Metabacillus sediminilitoris]THF74778.1 hypothetical protein E6W99_24825 [Metabacillus sediminilitoris]